jgi:uncharacterized protein DUF1572
MSDHDFRAAYLHDIARTFRNYKKLAERAIEQTSDGDLHAVIDPESNSIAIIVKHLAGNLRARFAEFLTGDGEKTRDRDAEFEMPDRVGRAAMLDAWQASWAIAMGSIEALKPEDLGRTVYIRSEAFLVPEALNRLAAHTAYHVGQIVLLAKHFAGANWATLSIPKGRSAQAGVGRFKEGILPPR